MSKKLKLTWTNLDRALGVLGAKSQIRTLRCLKEAAISDQDFNAAVMLRDREKKLSGGVSSMNKPRKVRKA